MSTGGQTGKRMDGRTEVLQYPFCCFKKSVGFYKHKILFKLFPNHIYLIAAPEPKRLQ